MNTAPPPRPPKKDQTMGIVLIFLLGLMIAGALIWVGWQELKRSADPFATLERPSAADPSRSEGWALIAGSG
jgi:hypothetical protein